MMSNVKGRDLSATPSLIVLMSLQLAIPGGLLSSRARFPFTNRRLLCNNVAANCKRAFAGIRDPTLTRCLTLGVHPSSLNPTHGSGWIVQGQPITKAIRPDLRIPPTAVGGTLKTSLLNKRTG